MKRIRLAIIGAGHLGRIHARLAWSLPEVELVAVVDPIAASREAVAAENQTQAVASHEQLRGQIDAAVIATPTKYHHTVALDLLQQGVHLLVEKPITLCATDADELIDAAQQSNSVLQVGHVERFNPAFLAAKDHIQQPRLIEAVRAGSYTFRSTDVGVVLDLMIHDIDLALSLAQSDVERIDAIGGKVVGPNEDWAQARLTFANGAVASFSASRVHHTAQRTMQVTGDDGLLWLDFQAKSARLMRPSRELCQGQTDVNRLSPAEREAMKSRLATELLPMRDLPVVENNAILEELREFATAIQQGTPVTASGQVGRDAVAVAEEVLACIALNRDVTTSPVILPFAPTAQPNQLVVPRKVG
jgi:predicted dehydrogenase